MAPSTTSPSFRLPITNPRQHQSNNLKSQFLQEHGRSSFKLRTPLPSTYTASQVAAYTTTDYGVELITLSKHSSISNQIIKLQNWGASQAYFPFFDYFILFFVGF